MLSVDLAKQLRAAGLQWRPGPGDRFVVADRGIDASVFVLSDMTIEVHDLPTGQVVGFNGTTEWALDSVPLEDALWLPRETQLRDLLGDRFLGLEAVPPGGVVVVRDGDRRERHADGDVECAYARALLAVLARG